MWVAVDLDDVMLDFWPEVCASVKKEFDVDLDPTDVMNSWAADAPIKQLPWKKWGYKDWWDWLRRRDWLWPRMDAVDGAVGGVSTLRTAGHVVELLTSKPEWAEYVVWRWMGKWRGPFHKVTIVPNGESKREFSPAWALVDDSPKHIADWVTDEDRLGVLFDRFEKGPPLYSFGGEGCLRRARNWHEVVEVIQEEAELWRPSS